MRDGLGGRRTSEPSCACAPDPSTRQQLGDRRLKNDERDATDLLDLLRLGRLAESWIAPPEVREVREMVRYLPAACSSRLESLRGLIRAYDREITALDRRIAAHLTNHTGYWAIQAINGVGPVPAAVFVTEIGDLTRFS